MDLSRLRSAATNSGTLSSTLSSRGSEVAGSADIPGGIWQGSDANSASSLLSPQSGPLWDASDAFNSGQGILNDLAGELDTARERLGDAHDTVAGTRAYITSDGTVVVPPELEDSEQEIAQDAARKARDIIDEALESANNSDDNASSALNGHITPVNAPISMPDGDPAAGGNPFSGIGDFFQEHSTGGGPAIGYEESDKEERSGRTGGRRGGGDSDGDSAGSTNWRLFEGRFNPRYDSDDHPFYAEADAGAGITGEVGAMNSIDASIGASVGAGVEGSTDAGPLTFNGNAGVAAGADAGVGVDVGVDDGNLVLGGGAKGVLGIGGSLGGSVEVDLNEVSETWERTPPPTPTGAPVAFPN